jgi:hypothetical protein
MRAAVYNSAISDVASKSLNRAHRSGLTLRFIFWFSLIMLGWAHSAQGADWNGPEQSLARKIVAVTGPGAAAVAFENHSSLGKRDSDIIQNGLRSALEGLGLRFVGADQAAATVTVSLSETFSSYVWVAQIRQGAGDSEVVMISAPRPEGALAVRDSAPLSLRKTSLWSQADPILDVAVLEEAQTPTHVAVLDPEKVSLYRVQGGKWQQEQALGIVHNRPWPRDLRGRLIPGRDHLLEAYLPGVVCSSTSAAPLSLNCRESDDSWPLLSGTTSGGALSVFPSAGLANGASTIVPQMKAFFAPSRNYFTGALTPGVGKFATVSKFYSAALLPREKYTLWLFAATDGQIHMIDGVGDQAAKLGWGSDVASVKTACGAGWQVLATNAGEQSGDYVRAYEFPDREPVAVSAPVELPGAITAMWTEARGDSAVVVATDPETGTYEAFRLAMSCNQ